MGDDGAAEVAGDELAAVLREAHRAAQCGDFYSDRFVASLAAQGYAVVVI